MDRRRAAGLLLALAACFATATAAPTTSNHTALDLYDGAPEGCYYNFQHYGEGDRIMTNEPCLNCTCHNRMLMCYLRVCPFTKPIGQDCTIEKRADQCCPIVTCPDVPVDLLTSTTTSPAEYGSTGVGKLDKFGCSINGKYFSEGSKVPPTPNKPCEHCYCIRNMTTCVMQECTLHVDGCTPIYHKDVCCPVRYSCDHPEDEMPLLDDLSTTVRPTPGFLLTTTTISPVTQMSQDCVYDNRIFPDGALIKTEKACDHCYCMKGDIVCVVQECGTPMENEGKNCTALPPREGVCCPDTYICEGDEPSTTTFEPEELTPLVAEEKITTLSPPRRTSAEGSGYRNEPDEVTYTESPEHQFEIEGSGEEDEHKTVSQFVTDKPATGSPDDVLESTEEIHEYIPLTTTKPKEDETKPEVSTKDENILIVDSDRTTESQHHLSSTASYSTQDSHETITDKNQINDIGSGELPDDVTIKPDDEITETPNLLVTEVNLATTESKEQDISSIKITEHDSSESKMPVTSASITENTEKETTKQPLGIDITKYKEDKTTTMLSIKDDYITSTSSPASEESTKSDMADSSQTEPSTTHRSPFIEEKDRDTTEYVEQNVVTVAPNDSSQTVNLDAHYPPSTSAPILDDEFVTTESQELDTDEIKKTDHFEPQQVTASTPMLEEIEKDANEYTETEHIVTTGTSQIDDLNNLGTTTSDVSFIKNDKKDVTETTFAEEQIPEGYLSGTTNLPISNQQEITGSIPESTVDTSVSDKSEPEQHSSTTTTNLHESEPESTPSQEITTSEYDRNHHESSSSAIPSILQTEEATTEPDKGLNTIPSDGIYEEIPVGPETQKPPVVEETFATETDLEDKFGSDTESTTSLAISETLVPKEEIHTLTTESALRKEDYSPTEAPTISKSTTAIDSATEEIISTQSHDHNISTESDSELSDKTYTTSEPKYTESVEETTIAKETSTVFGYEPSTSEVTQVSEFGLSTEKVTTRLPLNEKETTTANQDDNEIFNEPRIPGEGDCLLNGVTYTNASAVPSTNKCQSDCKCVSSIIKCDPIICSPPPEYMNNCETIYDTHDACCPTYICDHKTETIPPQSHSHMSGTEAPVISPINCQGDQCEIDSDKKHNGKPSEDCKSGNCASSSDDSKEPSSDPHKVHILEKPLIDQKEGCIGGACTQVLCSDKNNCQATPVLPCEGDKCESDIQAVLPPETQLCAQGNECAVSNIPTKECIGESCDTSTELENTYPKEKCTEKDCPNAPKLPEEECKNDHCRRKESSPLDQNISEPCVEPNCKQPETDIDGTTPISDQSSQSVSENDNMDVTQTTEKLTTINEPSDQKVPSKLPEPHEIVTQSEFETTTKPSDFTKDQEIVNSDATEKKDSDEITSESTGSMNSEITDKYIPEEEAITVTTDKLKPEVDKADVTETTDKYTPEQEKVTETGEKLQPDDQAPIILDETKPGTITTQSHDMVKPSVDIEQDEISTDTALETTTASVKSQNDLNKHDFDTTVPFIFERSTEPSILYSTQSQEAIGESEKTKPTESTADSKGDDSSKETTTPETSKPEDVSVVTVTTTYSKQESTSEINVGTEPSLVKPSIEPSSHVTEQAYENTSSQENIEKPSVPPKLATDSHTAITDIADSSATTQKSSEDIGHEVSLVSEETSSLPPQYDAGDQEITQMPENLDHKITMQTPEATQKITEDHTDSTPSSESKITMTTISLGEIPKESTDKLPYDSESKSPLTEVTESITTPTDHDMLTTETPMSTDLNQMQYETKKPDVETQTISSPVVDLEKVSQQETTQQPDKVTEKIVPQKIDTEVTIESDGLKTTQTEMHDLTTSQPTEAPEDAEVNTEERLVPSQEISTEKQSTSTEIVVPSVVNTDIPAVLDTDFTKVIESGTEITPISSESNPAIQESYTNEPIHKYSSPTPTTEYDSTKKYMDEDTVKPLYHDSKEPGKPFDGLIPSLVTEQYETEMKPADFDKDSQTQSPIQVSDDTADVSASPQQDDVMEKLSTPSALDDITDADFEDKTVTSTEYKKPIEEEIRTELPSPVDATANEFTTPKIYLPDSAVTEKSSEIDEIITTPSEHQTEREPSIDITTESIAQDTLFTEKIKLSSTDKSSVDVNKTPTESPYITETPDVKQTVSVHDITNLPDGQTQAENFSELPEVTSDLNATTSKPSLEKHDSTLEDEQTTKPAVADENQSEFTTFEPSSETEVSYMFKPTTPPHQEAPISQSNDGYTDKSKESGAATLYPGEFTTEIIPPKYNTDEPPHQIVTSEKATTVEEFITTKKHREPTTVPALESMNEISTRPSVSFEEESTTLTQDIESRPPTEEQSIPVVISETEKGSSPEGLIAMQTERIVPASEKPIQETTAPEEEFIIATTKATTLKAEEDIYTLVPSADRTHKPTDSSVESYPTASPDTFVTKESEAPATTMPDKIVTMAPDYFVTYQPEIADTKSPELEIPVISDDEAPKTPSTIAPEPPETSASREPITNAPELPEIFASEAPITSATKLPTTSVPDTPTTRAPEQPEKSRTESPITSVPEESYTSAPVAPLTSAPELQETSDSEASTTIASEQQETFTSEVPITSEPKLTDISAPETPITSPPELPETSAPESLITSAPELPKISAPEAPITSAPELPESSTPEIPITSTPELLETSAPVSPIMNVIKQQETSAPEAPITSAPELPTALAPEAPITSAPELLDIPASKEPITSAPELPNTPASKAPITSAPELLETFAPEAPITSSPELQETSVPEAQITSAAVPESSAPEIPITSEAEQQETKTPEAPITSAPELPDTPASKAPITSAPELLETFAPEAPITSSPELQETSAPEAPITSASVPESSAPEIPIPSEAEQQGTKTPEAPITSAPELPDTPASKAPITSAPKLPDTFAPEATITSLPELQETSAPESPITSAPEQFSTASPDILATRAPEIPDTTASEEHSTSTPHLSTSVAPKEPMTNAPELPVTPVPELPKPVSTEAQPTDEVLTPDEEGSFPPSGGTSGYGQEPDYVEEDQTFGPGTCRYGGKVYVSAQQIPRDDPCDFCFCFRSDIICLQQSCPPPIHGCHEEPIQGFCCPRYECPVSMATTVNVTTTTTTTTTTLPPHFPTHSYKGSVQKRGCQIKGQTYKVGEVVRASSGPCLHCTCGGNGQMKCDPKVCTPEPMLRQMIAAAVSAKRRR